MDRDFLRRSYRATLALTALAVLFALVYLGPRFAVGLGAGALLGVLNLRLVEELIANIFRPQGARHVRVALAVALKLALVYGAGYALLASGVGTPMALAIGYPMVLAVIFMKALGRLLLPRIGAAPMSPAATEGRGKEPR